MKSVQAEIRRTAAELLSDGTVDLVMGFSDGSVPMKTSPCFISHAKDAARLVWNSYCLNNLAVYLPSCFTPDSRQRSERSTPKVAVIVKGCDARSAMGLIKERQVDRENLTIIAVPCEGMLDATIAQRLIRPNEIVAVMEDNGLITIEDDRGSSTEVHRDQLLAEACRFCTHRAATMYDVAIGDLPQNGEALAPDERFESFESKIRAERWEFFCNEISRCILCTACRNSCPNCYCRLCFADQTRPNWTGTGVALRDVMIYHLGRIFHQAGRCVDCGACVRACPLGIDLRTFTYKLVKDAKDSFGYTAGIDPGQVPLLLAFDPSDPEGFMTEPK